MNRGWRSTLSRVADVAIPAVVGLFLLALVLEPSREHGGWLTLLGVVAAVAQSAALWWRRSHPEVVTAIALAGGLVVQLLAPEGLFPLAGLVAMWSLAAVRAPRVSLPALAAVVALTALSDEPRADVLFAMAVAAGVWALGEATRNRRAAIAEGARRAAGEEQARIARELHDVIAHSVSVIVVQAAAADDVFDERPDQARSALRSIESAGRDALGDLRRLLEGGPQPGLARLDELTESLRAAGLEVDVRREGTSPSDRLPAGVDLSAYRIVQEALTNTLRHAGARRAEVTLRTTGDLLELDVRDDGRGAGGRTPGEAGRGIAGMRERAVLLGGTVDAGPLPGGGFHVRARLPIEASP